MPSSVDRCWESGIHGHTIFSSPRTLSRRWSTWGSPACCTASWTAPLCRRGRAPYRMNSSVRADAVRVAGGRISTCQLPKGNRRAPRAERPLLPRVAHVRPASLRPESDAVTPSREGRPPFVWLGCRGFVVPTGSNGLCAGQSSPLRASRVPALEDVPGCGVHDRSRAERLRFPWPWC